MDRTKELRAGKLLVFISLKPGFSKDIAKATVSLWIKQVIRLCYDIADSESFKVAKVKVHEVRAISASLAFKGGVALNDILSSCDWRSHGTFTNFT